MNSTEDRFWSKVNKLDNGCWRWEGHCQSSGYGKFWDGRKMVKAHRYAYKLLKGKIPPNLECDHLCRNRSCVNPLHIELVTGSENVKRGLSPELTRQRQLSKTHCPYGHPYDKANTYVSPNGKRECRICRRESNRRWYRKNLTAYECGVV